MHHPRHFYIAIDHSTTRMRPRCNISKTFAPSE